MSQWNWLNAALWAAKWRDLEKEALEIANAMQDPEARRHMVFVAESYGLLAERAEVRRDRLAESTAASGQSWE